MEESKAVSKDVAGEEHDVPEDEAEEEEMVLKLEEIADSNTMTE